MTQDSALSRPAWDPSSPIVGAESRLGELCGHLASIRTYPKGVFIYQQGEISTRFYQLLSGRVRMLLGSPEGREHLLAIVEPGGLFGEAALWKTADGSLVKKFRGHKDSLYAAELSPDGKTLATAGYDKLILVWDVASGDLRQTLKGHNDAVYALAFSPDGKWLASASGDRTAKLWEVATGARLETFPQALKELYTVAFHPSGRQLVAGNLKLSESLQKAIVQSGYAAVFK